MDRPGLSFNMGSPLPGQVNGGFTMTDGDDITVTSMSGNSRVATRKATEDRTQTLTFADTDRIEKGEPKFESFTEEYPADPSVLSAMERTLAAFMNQGLLLVGIGTALMTFNQYGPNIVGWVLVPVGVLHIVWSWYEFYLRLHRLQKGSDRPLSYRRSLWWTGALVLLIVAASAVELSCNIIYGAFVRVTFPDGEGQGMATTANP
ncbi:vacuolar transporter chaperone complex subunit 2-like [Branchiostoma floridae x Branchiostoma japonicum]